MRRSYRSLLIGFGVLLAAGIVNDYVISPEQAAARRVAQANAVEVGEAERAAAKEKRQVEARGVEAYAMCQKFVEQKLKAPRKAKFPWDSYRYTARLGESKYRVRAYVDDHSSFGVPIRSDFDCTVEWVGGDQWRLVDLQIQ